MYNWQQWEVRISYIRVRRSVANCSICMISQRGCSLYHFPFLSFHPIRPNPSLPPSFSPFPSSPGSHNQVKGSRDGYKISVHFEMKRADFAITIIYNFCSEQVRKVLWTRRAPACLLTLLYAYGKPRLCINLHHYVPPLIVLQQAAAMDAALYTHCESCWLLLAVY